MNRFDSKIEIIKGNPYVRPPDEVLQAIFQQAGRDKGPISVRGMLNGASFQQSLVKYMGDWRLYINGNMAKSAGFKFSGSIVAIVGREVKVALAFDSKPVTYPMVPQFKKALDGDRRAQAAYNKLTPGRQKEILRYLGFLKSEESLSRNIGRLLQHLRGEESDALYPLMHRKQNKKSDP
jgi:hypothetical protein